jgi:SPX domain protein involved in polyphosphate accumulation
MLKKAEKDLKVLKADKDKVIIEKKTLEEDYISMKGKDFELRSQKETVRQLVQSARYCFTAAEIEDFLMSKDCTEDDCDLHRISDTMDKIVDLNFAACMSEYEVKPLSVRNQ